MASVKSEATLKNLPMTDAKKNQHEPVEVPKKWRDGQWIRHEYAFPASEGSFSFAPPIITKKFIFGTFVNATPCK